jgi:hypothetical protein
MIVGSCSSFPASSTQTCTVTLWPRESSCFAFAGIFAGASAILSDALLAQLKAICCHESIGSPLPSMVAAANRSRETQVIVAESRAFEPEDDLMEMCEGFPLLGSQKTTTAAVPTSVIRRSGQSVLGLNPKAVCACNGFSGTGGTGAAWTSTGMLKITHARVAPSQLCIWTANVEALPARNQQSAPPLLASLPRPAPVSSTVDFRYQRIERRRTDSYRPFPRGRYRRGFGGFTAYFTCPRRRSSGVIVRPCANTEKATTAKVITTMTSRRGRSSGRDRERASANAPRSPPQKSTC